jgi:hypothetical protein
LEEVVVVAAVDSTRAAVEVADTSTSSRCRRARWTRQMRRLRMRRRVPRMLAGLARTIAVVVVVRGTVGSILMRGARGLGRSGDGWGRGGFLALRLVLLCCALLLLASGLSSWWFINGWLGELGPACLTGRGRAVQHGREDASLATWMIVGTTEGRFVASWVFVQY